MQPCEVTMAGTEAPKLTFGTQEWLNALDQTLSEKATKEELAEQAKGCVQKEEWITINEAVQKQMELALSRVHAVEMMLGDLKMKVDGDFGNIVKKQEKDDIYARMRELQEQVQNAYVSSSGGGQRDQPEQKKFCLTTKRSFSNLPKYTGKHEDFDDWKFKLTTFLSEEVEYKELILILDKVTVLPDESLINQLMEQAATVVQARHHKTMDRQWVNHQLYQVLCLNLEGKALSMIKNLQDNADNGVLGWCKLQQDCTSLTAQRLQGLANRVYQPKRCKHYSEVSAAIEEWEMQASALARAEKAPDNKLNDITRMYSLKQLVPEELEEDINKASTALHSYDLIKGYITEQVAVRRDVKNASKGPVSLDMHMMKSMLASMSGYGGDSEEWPEEKEEDKCEPCGQADDATFENQLCSFFNRFKGGKDGGKGGGQKGGKTGGKVGAKIEGTCHFCGKPGHKISECWAKDEEMKQNKGNGKGNFFDMIGKGGK